GGVTVFLTTQYLEEADQLADQIALLDHGTLIAEGTPEELKRRIPGGHTRLRFTDASTLAKAQAVLPPPRNGDGGARTLEVPHSRRSARPARNPPPPRRSRRGRRRADRAHPRPRRRVPHPHRQLDQGGSPMMTSALADSATMLRRNLKHMLRYPSMIAFMILMPVGFLLLFVYILGGTVSPAGHAGRAAYATFITPGIIALTIVAASTATAVSVASDMTGGII